MNEGIRYRQWIPEVKTPDGEIMVKGAWHYWGFWEKETREVYFVPPRQDIFKGTYPESLQSTGLHDNKGVEIWEGSITQHELSPTNIAVVERDKNYGMWRLGGNSDFASGSLADYMIGNYVIVTGDTTTLELMKVGK